MLTIRQPKEGSVTGPLLVWLRKTYGGRWDKIGQGARNTRGISDIIGTAPKFRGRYVAIEVKRPGRQNEEREGLSAPQSKFLQDILSAGGIAFKTDSLDHAKKVLGLYEN